MHTWNSDESLHKFLHGFRFQEVFRHGGEQGVFNQFFKCFVGVRRGKRDCRSYLLKYRAIGFLQQRETSRL